ncbi:MAG: DUF2914 domain-containing protein [Rhodospirillales bacterium]|nr:DUF2914 domain-containing protein [Rhodospirillales bacterium]
MSYLRTLYHRSIRRAGRSITLCGCAGLLAAAALGLPAEDAVAAPVGSVSYFRSFGQWTVICGRDDAGGHDNCTLSAPPPEFRGADSQIEIGHGSGEKAAVTMRVRGTLMPESPFYLRVDAKPPHQTSPNRFGEGGWSGAEAQTIIDELAAGQQVVVRWFVGPPPSPRDEVLSLDGFDEAMSDLAEKAGGGSLSQNLPPPAPPSPATSEPAAGSAASAAPAAGAAVSAGAAGEAPATAAPQAEPSQAQAPQPSQAQAPQPSQAQALPAEPARAGGQSGAGGAGTEILDQRIARAQLTSNVVNREPVDNLASPVKASGRDSLYFFTDIRDFGGRTVTHRWEHDGNIMASIPFQVGGDRWRVYSRKSIAPDQTGSWTVTASAPDGTVLARDTFVLE